MATNKQIPTEGQFFISVDGNRLKQHPGNTVYLENGKEFQLEVFNPTTSKILAKIKINGAYISTSGLVLKPGQRVFLERYLDIAKKFKYETYTVDNSPETAGAIANNGVVEVEFYNEYVPTPSFTFNPPIWTTYNSTPVYNTFTTCGGVVNTSYTNTGGSGMLRRATSALENNMQNISGELNSSNISASVYNVNASSYSAGDNSAKLSQQSLGNEVTMDAMGFADMFETKQEAKTKETGRVEQGSQSQQSFAYDYSTYNTYYTSKMTWKILPLSEKPYEVAEVTKNYCHECGARMKKNSWKFCPQCGNKM